MFTSYIIKENNYLKLKKAPDGIGRFFSLESSVQKTQRVKNRQAAKPDHVQQSIPGSMREGNPDKGIEVEVDDVKEKGSLPEYQKRLGPFFKD